MYWALWTASSDCTCGVEWTPVELHFHVSLRNDWIDSDKWAVRPASLLLIRRMSAKNVLPDAESNATICFANPIQFELGSMHTQWLIRTINQSINQCDAHTQRADKKNNQLLDSSKNNIIRWRDCLRIDECHACLDRKIFGHAVDCR